MQKRKAQTISEEAFKRKGDGKGKGGGGKKGKGKPGDDAVHNVDGGQPAGPKAKVKAKAKAKLACGRQEEFIPSTE